MTLCICRGSPKEYAHAHPLPELIPQITLDPSVLDCTRQELKHDGFAAWIIDRQDRRSAKLFFLDPEEMIISFVPTSEGKLQQDSGMRIADIWRIETIQDGCWLDGTDSDADRKVRLVSQDNRAVWCILCKTHEQCVAFYQTLSMLVSWRRPSGGSEVLQQHAMRLWFAADADHSGRVTYEELCDALPPQGIRLDPRIMQYHYERLEWDEQARGTLDFASFKRIIQQLTVPQELTTVFERFTSGASGTMSLGDLQRFQEEAQGEPLGAERAKDQLKAMTQGRSEEYITAVDFCAYMTDPRRNSWIRPEHDMEFQDMTQPLHHYFIMSSHNSALEGDQLTSPASAEWLGMVLRQGYRAVELEVFDGPEGTPVVGRCYSKCAVVSAAAALEAIRDNAFVASEYPVIVMLEMHTSDDQTQIFATQVNSVIGDLIHRSGNAAAAELSLHDLRRRILLMMLDRSELPLAADGKGVQGSAEMAVIRDREGVLPLSRSCPLLDSMVLLRSFPQLRLTSMRHPFKVFQVSCDTLTNVAERGLFPVIEFNRGVFTRTFPSRADSRNPSPLAAFMCGVQFSTMNAQTSDTNLLLYEGLFRTNGRTGYVLKPSFMRLPGAEPDSNLYSITVRVLLASQIPYPPLVDPEDIVHSHACISLHGSNGFWGAEECLSERVPADPLRMSFADESFTFRVRGIEQTFLSLTIVYSDDTGTLNVDAAGASVPLTSIRTGYRAVDLVCCAAGEPSNYATAFCYFSVQHLTGGCRYCTRQSVTSTQF